MRLSIVGLVLMVAGPLHAQRADTLRLSLLWEITEETAAVAESLGVLSGVAMDRGGNVYVSDRAAATIWVFDARGNSQRSIGRKGRGPGEFETPTGIVVGPDNRLWVRDMSRVNTFVTDPATGRLTRFESSFRGPPFADWTSTRVSHLMADGAFAFPSFNSMNPARLGWWMLYGFGGTLRDSIEVPTVPTAPFSTAYVQLDANGGRMIRGLNHVPFAPLPVHDLTPRGTVLLGDGKEYVIRELDRSGRVVREFRRQVTPERIPVAERRDSTAALRARIDSLQVPKSQVQGVPDAVWAMRIPETYPAYLAVYSGADGRVWVRRWVANGHRRSVFDVFEADGRFRAVVELPRGIAVLPTPYLSLDGIAAVGVDAETGAHVIYRFGR